MELMWLVYAVENLTYGGSFWGATFSWLLIVTVVLLVVKVGISIYNSCKGKKRMKHLQHMPH